MALELLGDERVRRAHEMEHLDNLAIARHCAARGEPDRRAHRDDHQHEKSGRKNDDSIRHGAEARRPDPMVVEISLRDGRGERRTQRRKVFGALAAKPARAIIRGTGS